MIRGDKVEFTSTIENDDSIELDVRLAKKEIRKPLVA